MDSLDNYELLDLNYTVEKLYKEITDNLTPVESPKGYILVGQPGAGKTTLQRMAYENDSNIAIINGDEYRKYHPHFTEIYEKYGKDAAEHTQSFSNALTNTLIEKISEDKYNLVVEGTGRRAEVPLKTCRDLKEKGYEVELMIMACNKDVAWESTIDRYEMMFDYGDIPRAVPRDKFDEAVRGLPNTVSELYHSGEFDEITMYNREEMCLYRMSKDSYDPTEELQNILNAYGNEYMDIYYAYSFYVNEHHYGNDFDDITDKLSIEDAVKLFKEKYQSFEPQDEYSMLTLGFDMIRADVSSSMNELKSLDLISVSDNELKVLSKEEVYSSGVFIEHPDPLGLIEDNDTLACYNITSVYLPQLQKCAEELAQEKEETLDLTQGQGGGRK